MAIDLNRVRERFDEERQSLEFPGVLLEACGSVVRHVSRSGTSSTIVYSRHDPEDLAAAIAAGLARRDSLRDSIGAAKRFVHAALRSSVAIGGGARVLDHRGRW